MSMNKNYFDLTVKTDLSELTISVVDLFSCSIRDNEGIVYDGFVLAKSKTGSKLTICEVMITKSKTDSKYQARPVFKKLKEDYSETQLTAGKTNVRVPFLSGQDGYREFWGMVKFFIGWKDIIDTGDFNDRYRIVKSEEYLDFLKQKDKPEKIEELGKIISALDTDTFNQVLNSKITDKDIVLLGFRKNQLEIFRKLLEENYLSEYKNKVLGDEKMKDEKAWQEFFEKNEWIFGYGLDYRYMNIFDREMSVGDGGTQDQDKPNVDFMNTFSDFTVLVELKLPNTELFQNSSNRAGAWRLSNSLLEGFSQVLEQKAEWQIKSNSGTHRSNDGSQELVKKTRDPKTILIVGNKLIQIDAVQNLRERDLKQDTFELFRRDSRNIEILTYDELYERAYYVVNQETTSKESYMEDSNQNLEEEVNPENIPF